MGSPAITGSATVNPPPTPPNRAVWKVDTKAKTSSATILTGVATISRKDNGRFTCAYNLKPAGEEGGLAITFPLNDCDTLVLAQARAEVLVREAVAKSRPNLVIELDAAEIEAAVAEAGDDPF